MAASSIWKLESEVVFPTNCFPARGIARNLHESSGSWVVAFAEEQENKFQASFKPKHVKILGEVGNKHTEGTTLKGEEINTTLDAKFLMSRHHVRAPLDLCSVNISDQNLDSIKEEDLKKFTNVAYINASENILPFRPFNNFESLRELELPVNGLRNLQLKYGDFPNLQVLDLSYNNLSTQDVLILGMLESLKVLTLTGNGLHSVPPDMTRPFMVEKSDGHNESVVRYKSLEVLLLDENHLSDLSTFAALAALPQLRELNLDKNGIEVIPHLKVVGDKVISEVQSSIGHQRSASSGRKSQSSRRTSSAKLKAHPSTEVPETESKRNMATSTTFLNASSEVKLPETTDSMITLDLLDSSPNPPFKQLRLLTIANNLISEEECVLAVAAWPRLKHLVMHGNPIVKNKNGEPSLLSHYLRSRLGISIHRFQPKAPVIKPQLVMSSEKSRKVTSRIPKIPKQPVDVLIKSLQAPAESRGLDAPPQPKFAPQPPSKPKADEQKSLDWEDGIFLTQVDEEPVQEPEASKSKSKHRKDKRKSQEEAKKPVDTKFEGMEVLLDARPDSSLNEPIGIQGNVRALHHLLSHPTVFRTTDVTLDRVQPCYQPKSSRHVDAMAVARQRKFVKPQGKSEKLGGALHQLRERDVKAVEMPLVDALEPENTKLSSDEAYELLWEVEDKYRVVREESLRASRQAKQAFQDVKDKVAATQR